MAGGDSTGTSPRAKQALSDKINAPDSLGKLPPDPQTSPGTDRQFEGILATSGLQDDRTEPRAFTHDLPTVCYRNSLATLLMHIEPFVNWLNCYYHPSDHPVPTTIMCHLGRLVQAYWRGDDPSGVLRFDHPSMPNFWKHITTKTIMNHAPWDANDLEQDPCDLLHHFMEIGVEELFR